MIRPSFFRDGKWTFGFPYLKALAFFGAAPADLRDMVRDIDERAGKRLRNDWPCMRQCDEVGAALGLAGRPGLGRGAHLERRIYHGNGMRTQKRN